MEKENQNVDVHLKRILEFIIFTSASSDKNKWIINSLKYHRELWKIEFLHRDVESSEKLAELEIKELAFCFDGIKCINPLCLNKCNPVFSSRVDVSGYKHSEEQKKKNW